jgi:hypothetical protein
MKETEEDQISTKKHSRIGPFDTSLENEILKLEDVLFLVIHVNSLV